MSGHQFEPTSTNGVADLQQKLSRLQQGGKLRVLDLFAGCGGLSLGFHSAGYQVVGAVETDSKAARSHAANFFGAGHLDFELHARSHDIRQLPPHIFAKDILKAAEPGNQIDIIVGGPPCQAFARIGRAKLREILNHPDAHLSDDRASLYTFFLEYVEHFRPLAVLMENVPEIISFGGKNVAEEIAVSLEDLGYRCAYTILNAAHYGVPQMRQRVFILAVLDALAIDPDFPLAGFSVDVPEGYIDARHAALKGLQPSSLGDDTKQLHFVRPPDMALMPYRAVSTREAIGDLPVLTFRDIKRGVKKFHVELPYRKGRPSRYAQQMREWVGFEARSGVWDHVTRYLPRDHVIFRRMEAGDEYPRALEIAVELFENARRRLETELGHPLRRNDKRYKQLYKSIVPPYSADKFPNKWCKMDPDKPARTLTAHIGKDTYTHIHYADEQARVITVREAARLQSFPDGFVFEGPMNPAFRQVGNAVPPLLAAALARHIKNRLDRAIGNVLDVAEGLPVYTDHSGTMAPVPDMSATEMSSNGG